MPSIKLGGSIIDETFHDKKPVKPIFYITYGPPASGKSSIMKKYVLKEQDPKTLISVIVDDIVMKFPNYSNKRKKILQNKNLSKEEKAKKLQDLYFKYRKSADIISTNILNRALLNKYSIVWETTGGTIAWTVREINRIKRYGYEIQLVYPFVDDNELIRRAELRAQKSEQESAPKERIKEIAMKAQRNIMLLLDYVDKLYIFDNTGSPGNEYLMFSFENIYEWTKESNTPGRVIKTWCNSNKKSRFCKTINSFKDELRKLVLNYCNNEFCSN